MGLIGLSWEYSTLRVIEQLSLDSVHKRQLATDKFVNSSHFADCKCLCWPEVFSLKRGCVKERITTISRYLFSFVLLTHGPKPYKRQKEKIPKLTLTAHHNPKGHNDSLSPFVSSKPWYTAWFVCLLVAYRPNNTRVYLRDGSAHTILRAATLRWKLQIQLSISPSHSILTPGRPVPVLTL